MSAGRPVAIVRVGSSLLATIQTELHDTLAEGFQEDLLGRLARSGAAGLVMDISALDMVDSYVARVIAETGRMASLMGSEAVLVGMQPHVAATLVRMGFQMRGVHAALDVDEGLALIEALVARRRRRGER